METSSGLKFDDKFSLFDQLLSHEHEQIVVCSDPHTELKAIIAIHDSSLGPALGGTRMWQYANDQEALYDVLRLSKGMTYKASVSGLNLGGGKAVIIGDPRKNYSEAFFRTYGRYIEGLGGRYITAEDVSIGINEIEKIRMETKHVVGIPERLGGSGDPSPVTAYGTFMGMKACAKELYGSDDLSGKKVAVQGAGSVSDYLLKHLSEAGAKVYVSDIFEDRVNNVVNKYGVTPVDANDIYDVDADIFSPSALGGIINDETIPKLKCDIIAGAANNQLEDENKHGKQLIERSIMYAPDYVINAGGLINVAHELEPGGYNEEAALKKAAGIYDRITEVLDYASTYDIPTFEASNRLAEDRIQAISKIKSIYASSSP